MASSLRPSFSSFRLQSPLLCHCHSLSSSNPSQRLSLFHHATAVPRYHSFGMKSTKLLRHDGRSMRVNASRNLSQTAIKENVLDWVKQDKRRMLHVVYRVGDLDRTIKFYTECLGMKLLRKRDMPEQRYTNAFLGYGPEDAHFVIELTYNYGIDKYDMGNGFGHFGIAVDDSSRIVDIVRAKGGKVTREPGPVKGGSSIIAFIEDPDGYKFELLEKAPSPEPLCKVMLRVGDLNRSVEFYEKAFGMQLLRTRDNPESKYTVAMMGYGAEDKNTVLELTYNYAVKEYDKGEAYAQIAIGTDDVYKTAEAIKLAGGKIVREPGPIPGIRTKITACLDPDGWKTMKKERKEVQERINKSEESEEDIDVKMDDTSENVETKAKSTRRKVKEHRHFGNFRHYYERRNKDLPEDRRLKYLRKEWFEGKDVLDIGCNCGTLTITIAQMFLCRSILAIDIDHDLVKKAKRRLKKIVSEAKKVLKEKGDAEDDSSNREISSLKKTKLRQILKFNQQNFITSDLKHQEAYDTILCLSITQWIHLNWGDRGIITLFAKIWQLLRPGGVLMLEPQPWRCYVTKHDISIVTSENYNKIQLFPEQFQEILLDKIGFRTVEHLNPGWEDCNIRFNRPILVFKK